MTEQIPRKTLLGPVKKRELVIIKAIKEHPGIHNNALKRIIVEEEKIMYTRTFDRIIKELRESNHITVDEKGNKKCYNIPSIEGAPDSKNLIIPYLKSMDEHIALLMKVYPKLSYAEKLVVSQHLIKQLLSNRYGLELLLTIHPTRQIPEYRQIKDRFKRLLKRVIRIISDDSDGGWVNSELLFSIMNFNQEPNNEIASLLNAKK